MNIFPTIDTSVTPTELRCAQSGWRTAECRCQTHRPDLHLSWSGLNSGTAMTVLPISIATAINASAAYYPYPRS